MFYGNYLSTKYTQYRNKTWSAPMLMGTFIVISMLLVFSCEQIGLFRKENNLTTAIHIGKSKKNILLNF